METQTVCANGASAPGTPMKDGVPPRDRMTSAGDGVQLQGRDARADGLPDGVEGLADEATGLGHALDLRPGLERHAPAVEEHPLGSRPDGGQGAEEVVRDRVHVDVAADRDRGRRSSA